MLVTPAGPTAPAMRRYNGPDGPNAQFLKDFGPALLKKYKPKALVVFSAHWDTDNERLGEKFFHDFTCNVVAYFVHSVGLWRHQPIIL
jgi:hypothetical protein